MSSILHQNRKRGQQKKKSLFSNFRKEKRISYTSHTIRDITDISAQAKRRKRKKKLFSFHT
jgi:hypothetical protein